MTDLDQLRNEVANLNVDESSPFEFRDAFNHIEDASKSDIHQDDALRSILSDFRGKLPNMIILQPIRVRARDLANDLTVKDLAERIATINARNEALGELTGELQTQIDKANADANLLNQIKEAVDKATKTVNEAKSLVDQLKDTDASTKDKLKALIETLGNVSSIFKPKTP